MNVRITDETVEIHLSRAEKILGLMRDISVPRSGVADVRVLDDGVREAMASGIKVGLRIPWVRYVARTIRLDEAFIVRRGLPALSFSVRDRPPLERVVLSTPEAHVLAEQLRVS